MGPLGCPETSVRNYYYSLHNNPEERSSQLLRGGSLKSRTFRYLDNINIEKELIYIRLDI